MRAKNVKCYILYLIAVILVMQLFDSYCAELFDKLQSFLLSDFLIDGRNMKLQEAVSYMGYATLPFYVIPALAPLARISIDKIGIKVLFMINITVLMTGCAICAAAPTLVSFLIGNGLVIFSTSMDIQYIYIAKEIPEHRRATMRGMSAGVAAIAAMGIPLFRNVWMERQGHTWRNLYAVGIAIGVFTFFFSICLAKEKSCKKTVIKQKPADKPEAHMDDRRFLHSLCISLFILGIATSGITFYNEPLLTFGNSSPDNVRNSLFVQPVVTLLVNVASGYLADRWSRKNVVLTNIGLSMIALILFVCSANSGAYGFLPGITWGIMVGSYFSAANLLILSMLEAAPAGKVGKISALSTYVNGAGNAIGILLCTVFVKNTGMGRMKLLVAIPVLVGSFIYLLLRLPAWKAD